MEQISQKDIEWLLQTKGEFRFNPACNHVPQVQVNDKSSLKRLSRRIAYWALLIFSLVVLPFLVLVRLSVYLYLEQGLSGWSSLGAAMIACILLLVGYLIYLFRVVKNKRRLIKGSLLGSSILVVGFSVYGLLYLSSVNAKSENVSQVYRSLHPILRVAVASTTLAASDLVITDIKRTPADYARMGIPLNESSLHFEQRDNYVHAIDIRTKGHSEFRNLFLEESLSLLGFQTIRHVGTADHLHVALPVAD